jgi:hypothetical protein
MKTYGLDPFMMLGGAVLLGTLGFILIVPVVILFEYIYGGVFSWFYWVFLFLSACSWRFVIICELEK